MQSPQDPHDPQVPPDPDGVEALLPPVDPDDPNLPPDPAELEALKKVVKRSFAANPAVVQIFGTTKISWNVTVPAESAVEIFVKLNGEFVAYVGSKDFSLSSPKEFSLVAATENRGKPLGSLMVGVDRAECQSKLVSTSPDFPDALKNAIDGSFPESPNAQLKLRDKEGSKVIFGDGIIFISIPLEIEVPHWYNADMSVDIQLGVSTGATNLKPVNLTTKSVSVDFSWSFLEHLTGNPLTDICMILVQEGMEVLAQVFVSNIVEQGLVPTLKQLIVRPVSEFLNELKNNDLQQRIYKPTLVALSPAGIEVTACPLPNM